MMLLPEMARAAFVSPLLLVVAGGGGGRDAWRGELAGDHLSVARASVVASSTYTVEWTGTGPGNRYDVDLYYCDSDCVEDDDCGDWVTALCPYAELGCFDNEGSLDTVMPEPMPGTSGSGGYKVRVMDVADESIVDCSSEFTLVSSDNFPSMKGSRKSSLVVTSPKDGDLAFNGEQYTVEFDYQKDGVSPTPGRFSIDLYRADGGSGDCGTYMTSICDKPGNGCKDSKGDYDVIIPEDVLLGEYKIRVGPFGNDKLFGCSGTFEVVSDLDSTEEGSLSFSFSHEFVF